MAETSKWSRARDTRRSSVTNSMHRLSLYSMSSSLLSRVPKLSYNHPTIAIRCSSPCREAQMANLARQWASKMWSLRPNGDFTGRYHLMAHSMRSWRKSGTSQIRRTVKPRSRSSTIIHLKTLLVALRELKLTRCLWLKPSLWRTCLMSSTLIPDRGTERDL